MYRNVKNTIITVGILIVSIFANEALMGQSIQSFDHQRGQWLEIEGAKIYYEEIGNRDRPALLIIHGGFQNIEDMNGLVSYLTDSFRVIGIDSRGHGKSSLGNGALSYQRIQLDAEAIIKHLGIEIVSIIGFSDGGTVAYRMAANNAVKIDKLITIGASWSLKDVARTKEYAQGVSVERYKNKLPRYKELNPEPDFEKFVKQMSQLWQDTSSVGHPDQSVININVATLIIRGETDTFVTLESAYELTNIIKQANFLNVPFAGHSVYSSQKEICEIVIKSFLKRK
jgi:pimeloyl-ACP methyl ester carboxylesterase